MYDQNIEKCDLNTFSTSMFNSIVLKIVTKYFQNLFLLRKKTDFLTF